MRRTLWMVRDAPRALAADARDVPPRRVRQCELAIDGPQFARHAAAIHLPEQNRGCRFNYRHGGLAQNIGEPHQGYVLPQAQRVREIGVGIQLDLKLRRPALAPQAREDALKNAVAPEKRSGPARAFPQAGEAIHVGLRRTGGALISLEALSTSFCASCVASIASSRFDL